MSSLVQHIIVLSVVAVCGVYVVAQFINTLGLKRGRAGACCSKGCDASPEMPDSALIDASAKPQSGQAEPVAHFIPADALRRKRNT
jgi:hypothetical protein